LTLRLITALEKAPGVASMPAARLTKLVENSPAEVRPAVERFIQRLANDNEVQARRYQGAWEFLDGGDPARGQRIFFGKAAACAACHRVRSQGEEIGPDLSHIGAVRARRDLLESLVFPSTSFARGYEPMTVATKSGRVHYGILSRETGDTLTLRTAQRETVRIVRTDIETMTPGKVSIMPAGLDKVLTPDELRDLIAYLSSLK
jgi:putative heme-binding domain-containing protein